MMRITNKMFYEQTTSSLAQSQSTYFDAKRVAETGRLIATAADEPTVSSFAMRSSGELNRIENFLTNNNRLKAKLDYADSALAEASETFNKLYEMTIQVANGVHNAPARNALADQVTYMKKQVIQLANTQTDGVYVFAGYKTDSPVFDDNGTFIGDANDRTTEISEGVYAPLNSPGYRYFTATGGLDLMKVFDDVEAAMRSNDQTKLANLVGSAKGGIDQITLSRTDVGNKSVRIEMTNALLVDSKDLIIKSRAGVVEAIPEMSYLDLSAKEAAYMASLKVSASAVDMSLVAFMK